MFAQPMSSTRPTAARSTSSAGRTSSPNTNSRQVISRTSTSSFVTLAAFCWRTRSKIARCSAVAAAIVTPGLSRAQTPR
jgi:hypothetical protein